MAVHMCCWNIGIRAFRDGFLRTFPFSVSNLYIGAVFRIQQRVQPGTDRAAGVSSDCAGTHFSSARMERISHFAGRKSAHGAGRTASKRSLVPLGKTGDRDVCAADDRSGGSIFTGNTGLGKCMAFGYAVQQRTDGFGNDCRIGSAYGPGSSRAGGSMAGPSKPGDKSIGVISDGGPFLFGSYGVFAGGERQSCPLDFSDDVFSGPWMCGKIQKHGHLMLWI